MVTRHGYVQLTSFLSFFSPMLFAMRRFCRVCCMLRCLERTRNCSNYILVLMSDTSIIVVDTHLHRQRLSDRGGHRSLFLGSCSRTVHFAPHLLTSMHPPAFYAAHLRAGSSGLHSPSSLAHSFALFRCKHVDESHFTCFHPWCWHRWICLQPLGRLHGFSV